LSDILNTIDNLPDISFIDNLTLEDIQSLLLNHFTAKYQEITGKKVELSRADPNRIILLGCAQMIYQGLQNIDKAGKMNFLKYAYGSYLEHMGAFKKVERNPAKTAQVELKFTLSGKREAATGIPAGTRVTSAYEVYFKTVEYAEVPPGELEVTVLAECTEAGTVGNDFAAGELSTLVDPVGFVAKVENTEKSAGGAETESDQSMAERIFLSPSSYSTAGPGEAYEYWVKDSNAGIGDVKVTSPTPGVVDIRFVMKDGSVPDDGILESVQHAVNSRGRRPLTDYVQIKKPETEAYTVDLTYFINTSDSTAAAAIQGQVSEAVREYKIWQDTRVGRDINPDELIAYIKNAGAKRAVVREPEFRVIGETAIAQCSDINVIYGGLEDD